MVARSSIQAGVLLAALSAVAFGVATPIVAWAGRGLGPFSTAALLYLGAALAAVGLRLGGGRSGPGLRRGDGLRVALIAVLGGAVAPTLLAWGLQRAGATIGALLLNLEAVFTVVLARAFYREPIGRRVAVAVVAMVAGGAALTLDVSNLASWGPLGIAAVAGATLAWALDNTLTRPLSERDPLEVIAAKGALGAALTTVIAWISHEPQPAARAVLVLLATGAIGYGVSLRCYLLAQRRIGAGRTGSVFALAPFIGAAVAVALGDRAPGPWTVVAAILFAAGVYLHLTERHAHRHAHAALDHDHPHRHDDGHHDHGHEPACSGAHSHPHRHEAGEHAHDHAPDLHHDHH